MRKVVEYRVVGKSRETGRQRKRTYTARSEAHARELAEADGLSVQTVAELQPAPLTQAQLDLLAKLDVEPPTAISKEALSDLIDQRMSGDTLASSTLRSIAEGYGLVVTEHIGERRLFKQIFEHLLHLDRKQDLAGWFTYRVYSNLLEGGGTGAIQGPRDEAIKAIAAEIVQIPGVIDSIRRYQGDALIRFGEWTDLEGSVHRGGSNRTAAYKEAAQRLKPMARPLQRPEDAPRQTLEQGRVARAADSRTIAMQPERRSIGCLPVIVGIGVAVGLAAAATSALFA